MALLRLLAERESYGYELVGRLHELGLKQIQEGSVYPALSRLEREVSVTARLVSSTSGPARKYYRPSPAGYSSLGPDEDAWATPRHSLEPILSRPVPKRPQEAKT